MTTQFNKQNISADHEPFSASTQRSSLRGSAVDDRIHSAPGQPALRPCIYVAFRCSRCGSVRQAITELPAEAIVACPRCEQECAFVLLASGLTSRALPFHQVHIVASTRWDSHLDSEQNTT